MIEVCLHCGNGANESPSWENDVKGQTIVCPVCGSKCDVL